VALWGAWGASLPAVQQHAGVSDDQLGFALLLVGLGALASMRIAGALFNRFGGVGFVVGPTAVGGVAGLADLRIALAVVACPAAALALIAALGPLPGRLPGSSPNRRARRPSMRLRW
jgi:predicted MFS family arabinose efflux permease